MKETLIIHMNREALKRCVSLREDYLLKYFEELFEFLIEKITVLIMQLFTSTHRHRTVLREKNIYRVRILRFWSWWHDIANMVLIPAKSYTFYTFWWNKDGFKIVGSWQWKILTLLNSFVVKISPLIKIFKFFHPKALSRISEVSFIIWCYVMTSIL